jgi:hypothetical protein
MCKIQCIKFLDKPLKTNHMKRKTLILTILFAAGFWSVASANLLSLTCSNDTSGAINYNYGTWNWGGNTNYASVYLYGSQSGPGTMWANILTDSASDPTLRFHTDIENGSGIDWTAYNVTVFLSQPFTITNPVVSTPGDWTISYSTNATWNGSAYVGYIDFTGGTPVSGNPESPGTFDYAYKLVFEGATSYTLSQVLTPVPEPGTGGLLAMSLVLGAYINRRLRR